MILNTLRTIKNLVNIPYREYKKFKIKKLPKNNTSERGSFECFHVVKKFVIFI